MEFLHVSSSYQKVKNKSVFTKAENARKVKKLDTKKAIDPNTLANLKWKVCLMT